MAICFCIFAQEQQSVNETDWRKDFKRHEISFGIGDPAFSLLYRGGGYYDITTITTPEDSWFPNLSDTYHGPYYSTCPLAFQYMYRLKKFLWLGGTFSYTGVYAKRYDASDNSQLGWNSEHYITLMPSIRFSYFNREYLTMYSGISTGVVLSLTDRATKFLLPVQVTGFGISVGKTWHGFAEFGFGMNGFVRTGFGYRFNSK